MANQRWPSDKNIEFINEYKRNECLWDPKHRHYKNRLAREEAYKEIMKAMEMETVKDVINKIRILRNTYNNEILKAKKMIQGTVTDKQYISKIPWVPHMEFLKDIDGYTRDNTENGIRPMVMTNTQALRKRSVSSTDDSKTPHKVHKDPLRVPSSPEMSDAYTAKVKSERRSNTSDNGRNEMSEYDAVGINVARKLQKMDPDQAIFAESIINNVIRNGLLRKLTDETELCMNGCANAKYLSYKSEVDENEN